MYAPLPVALKRTSAALPYMISFSSLSRLTGQGAICRAGGWQGTQEPERVHGEPMKDRSVSRYPCEGQDRMQRVGETEGQRVHSAKGDGRAEFRPVQMGRSYQFLTSLFSGLHYPVAIEVLITCNG
jgi:hypothetical protein